MTLLRPLACAAIGHPKWSRVVSTGARLIHAALRAAGAQLETCCDGADRGDEVWVMTGFLARLRMTLSGRRGRAALLVASVALLSVIGASSASGSQYRALEWGLLRGPTPTQVGEVFGVKAVAADASTDREVEPVESLVGLMLLDGGTVMTWTERDLVPTEASGLLGVTAIAAGSYDLALLSDGTVMELTSDSAPMPVSGISNASAVASSDTNGAALLGDGTVRTWGTDELGALGDGGGEGTEAPVEVCAVGTEGPCPDGPYLGGVRAIALGEDSGLALLSDGTVVRWGDSSSTPVPVGGLSGVQAISTAGTRFDALMNDGTVKEWSTSLSGEASMPATVGGLSNVSAISTGLSFSMALIGNGTVMSWGDNRVGELGDGKRSHKPSTVPVMAKGVTGAVGINAGAYTALAFGTPTPPTIKKISPKRGPTAGGTTVTITGANLSGAEVEFGSTPAEVASDSSTSITVVSPPAGAGKADVIVTTRAGSSPISSKYRFTFKA